MGADWVDELAVDAASRYRRMYDALWASDLDPTIVALCHARICQLLRAPAAEPPGTVDSVKVASVARWPTDERFTERERAALDFAEQFVLDPSGVTDEQAAGWRAALSDAELTALTTAVAVFDAAARCRIALDLEVADAPATT